MTYLLNSLCTIKIIYHTINNHKIKKIYIYGYNQYFLKQYFHILSIKSKIIKKIKILMLQDKTINSALNLLKYLKQSGYTTKITYINFMNIHNTYHIMNITINPILHKIRINNYKELKIPLETLTLITNNQLGNIINFHLFNYTINCIRKWYISKGFYWIQITWQHIKYKSENIINVRIYEGQIYKTFIYCEDHTGNEIYSNYIKKLNYQILQYLHLYKKSILNKHNLDQRISKLNQYYNIKNMHYNIYYYKKYNQLIITIKYRLLYFHCFSSYKFFTNPIFTTSIYQNIISHFYVSFLMKKIMNIHIALKQTYDFLTLQLYIIYPNTYSYKKFIIKFYIHIYYKYYLHFFLNQISKYQLHHKKLRIHSYINNSIDIEHIISNSRIITQKMILHKLKLITKYIDIKYSHISQLLNIRKTYTSEIAIYLIDIIYYSDQLLHVCNKYFSLDIIYTFFQCVTATNYLKKSIVTYFHNYIYIEYSKPITTFYHYSLKHHINLLVRLGISTINRSNILEYLLKQFPYRIGSYNHYYPINTISISYFIQIHELSSFYYFICYSLKYFSIDYNHLLFPNSYNICGVGIKLNLNNIIRQIPQINLEYSINSNKQIYFYIYTT